MNLILLAIALFLLTAAAYWLNNGQIVAPAVLFCGGFTLAAICALLMSGVWNLSISVLTVWVLVGGCLTFVIFTSIVHRTIFRRVRSDRISEIRGSDNKVRANILPARSVALTMMLMLYLVVIACVCAQVTSWFPGRSLFQALGDYKESMTFTTQHLEFAFPLKQVVNVMRAAGYLFALILAERLINMDRPKIILSGACVILAAILGLVVGGRFLGLSYLACSFVTVLIFRMRSGNKALSKNILVGTAVGIVGFLILFQFLSFGRSGSIPFLEYLGIYLGAPISNLNTFLLQGSFGGAAPFGRMTFYCIYTYIGYKFGIGGWQYAFDLPFQTLNGYSMGNVYTTFYSFLYDFGYVGMFLLVAVMATASQLIYERAMEFRGKWDNIWVLLSSYISFQLIFSFFSNKFYEEIVSPGFVTTAIYFAVTCYFICFFHPRKLLLRLENIRSSQK